MRIRINGRPRLISIADLAFCYELKQEGHPWKLIESLSGHKKSTIIKSTARIMSAGIR
jgi:hypothetical protein